MEQFDVCVLGSGPGGYVAAIRCAQLGLKTCIIEKEGTLGGTCLNWGCIPTKALLHCAEACKVSKDSEKLGVKNDNTSIDISKMVEHSRSTVAKLNSGVSMLMKKNKIEVINGFGKFLSKYSIQVEEKSGKSVVNFKNAIIATGSRARELPLFSIDEDKICTYKGAMVPKTLPKKLVIIGGGVIGLEFANFYSAIGTDVSVIDIADDILMQEDKEIRKIAKKKFEKNGIKFYNKASVVSCDKNGVSVAIEFEHDGKKLNLNVDKAIVSVGIVPNVENIGLESIGIKQEKSGHIVVDEFCGTNVENIYAIGDVIRGPWLAHKASHEGIIAAENISGLKHKMKYNCIPSCIYTFPQIASVGITEEKALSLGLDVKVGKFSGIGNGKCIASCDEDAFVKTIFDKKTGELLGVHIIGKNATEMIHSAVLTMNSELVDEDFISMIFPHPTASEMIHESVLDSNGKSLHS